MSQAERPSETSDLRFLRGELIAALLIAILTAASLGAIFATRLTILTPLTPADTSLVEGSASPLTILAPDRITFPSPLRTNAAQDQAAAAVADVYDQPDANVAREQVRTATRVMDFLDTVRADPYSSAADKTNWITAVPSVTVSSEVVSRTLALDATSYRQVISETLYVLDQAMRDEIRQGDLDAAHKKLTSRVSLVLSADQAELVTEWAGSFLVPNTSLNIAKTEAARQLARESVSPVYRTIEKGQAVVRAGEVITSETTEVLREIGYLQPQDNYQETVASILFAIFLVILSTLYLTRVAPQLIHEPRVLLILSALLIATALGAKIVVPGRSIIPYLFPFAAAGMLGAALLSIGIGTGLTLLVALIVGYISRGTIELTFFALVGGLVAVMRLRQRERLTDFIGAGFYVALVNAALILIFHLGARDDDFSSLIRLLLAAAASGALAGLIALGGHYLLGKLAGLTTALELIELSRPTHPLLQKLLREAPGTYHHSLIISNLAEQAAQRIGANSLLARVGAYYHDVGKTLNPQFYVENQFDNVNAHDALQPHQSAAIIRQHVLDGINLAKRYGISARVRDLIPQHHGTTLSLYFYEKALAQAHGNPVDENDFRYPGPKPQTREAAIMMLADGVEATTRAERPTSAEEIRAIIDRMFEQRIHEGQLDESLLTLRDLAEIKQAFLEVLQGLYHTRVRYPQPSAPRAVRTPTTADVQPRDESH
jgi:putative nucleotidyltransferase with HDIG domain